MESERRTRERSGGEGGERVGQRLRERKRRELRAIRTEDALRKLAGAFESCRRHFVPSPTSGLVEQQRWFQKLRP